MAHAPSFVAARMYRKVSQSGTEYFVGRMGGVKLSLLLDRRETAEDGGEIWKLHFSEAAPYQPPERRNQT